VHGGADVRPLVAAGVPAIDLAQDMTRYFDVHHTANDTLDQVRPDEIARAASVFAAAAYALSRMDGDLGRVAPVSGEH
jgi:Zn-dependent M28 family amino/carboxypeptidase